MTVYRVRDWALHFENNRTRELKHMDWLKLPNKMDGDGYTELLDHPEGAAHFGAFIALLEVASKCEPRGTLLRAPEKPHTADSLSRITRIRGGVFETALPRLIRIGWIEAIHLETKEVAQIPHEDAAQTQEAATSLRESDPRQDKTRGEGEGTCAAVAAERPAPTGAGPAGEPAGFAEFWAAWPRHHRKRGRAECLRKWKRLGLDALAAQVIDALKRCKASPDWTKNGGEFIPLPMTWLNQTPWETDPAEMAGDPSPLGVEDPNGFMRQIPSVDLLREVFE